MNVVDSPPGITSPSSPSSCSGLRTSTGSAPRRRSIAACSRKFPCTARTPIFMARILDFGLEKLGGGDRVPAPVREDNASTMNKSPTTANVTGPAHGRAFASGFAVEAGSVTNAKREEDAVAESDHLSAKWFAARSNPQAPSTTQLEPPSDVAERDVEQARRPRSRSSRSCRRGRTRADRRRSRDRPRRAARSRRSSTGPPSTASRRQ